jgi:hypothetical protein
MFSVHIQIRRNVIEFHMFQEPSRSPKDRRILTVIEHDRRNLPATADLAGKLLSHAMASRPTGPPTKPLIILEESCIMHCLLS